MTPEEVELANSHLDRTVIVLERLRTVFRNFMDSKVGTPIGSREILTAYSIIERNHFNIVSLTPLVKEVYFNQNFTASASHIFRALVYEMIVSYWLLEKDFNERITIINHDYIKKSFSKIKNEPGSTDERLQRMFAGWRSIAPENFVVDGAGVISPRNDVKGFNFTNACSDLINNGYDVKTLIFAYHILSQQAHFSEFSREAVYQKSHQHIGVFDAVIRHVLISSIYLINKIDNSSSTIKALESLLKLYPSE